jgi:ribosome-associated translation inhibitor RaiA
MKASIDELTEKLVRQIREERDKKTSKRQIDKHSLDKHALDDGAV